MKKSNNANWEQVPNHSELWHGEYLVPNFKSRSIAICCEENHYVVISPGAQLLNSWKKKIKIKNIKLSLIIPNLFHFMGIQEWLSSFPQAKVYSLKEAIPKMLRNGIKNVISIEDKKPKLPLNYSFIIPEGTRCAEVWIRKKDNIQGTLWITCDCFLNYKRYSNQPIARVLQKILDAAPGLKISAVIKWFIIKDRKQFKIWIKEQIENDKPTTLIPSHGEIISDPTLHIQIKNLVDARL